MQVRQLVGPHAGELIEMPYREAQACLACGSAALPDATVRVRGLTMPDAGTGGAVESDDPGTGGGGDAEEDGSADTTDNSTDGDRAPKRPAKKKAPRAK